MEVTPGNKKDGTKEHREGTTSASKQVPESKLEIHCGCPPQPSKHLPRHLGDTGTLLLKFVFILLEGRKRKRNGERGREGNRRRGRRETERDPLYIGSIPHCLQQPGQSQQCYLRILSTLDRSSTYSVYAVNEQATSERAPLVWLVRRE